MTIYTGVVVDHAIAGEMPTFVAVYKLSTELSKLPLIASSPLNIANGILVDNNPITVNHYSLGAVEIPSFKLDWYNRIHITPETIALGNVISNTQRQIEVWNANFAPATLASITASGTTTGLSLYGQAAPPLSYAPLQSRLYTLAVAASGDPVITADYAFDFGASRPSVAITGRRVVVWGFRPDWSSGITERLSWLTDVQVAYAGTEQRIQLRDQSRRGIEYSLLAEGNDARLLESLTFGWGARMYCLPVWWEADFITAPVSAGAINLSVTDADIKDYRTGGLLVIWQSSAISVAAEIDSINGNLLTLKQPLPISFGAGARIMPAVLARLSGEAQRAHQTDRIVTALARFEVEGNIDRTALEIGTTWQGYAVLDERPERSNDIAASWTRTLELLDYQTGIVTVDDTSGMPVIRRTYNWQLKDRQAIQRWKQWTAARAGRMNALWMPSFMDDLELISPVGSSDTSLQVRNTFSARYVGAHPLRPALRIELYNGQVYHRRVTGITELDANTETIDLDSTPGVVINLADVRRLMWISLVRLDADAVEFYYDTDSKARLQFTFKAIQQ